MAERLQIPSGRLTFAKGYRRQAKEIETLKKENYNLSFKNQNLEGQLRTNNIEMRRVQETTDRQIKAEASKLKPITNLFPEMENAQENIEELFSTIYFGGEHYWDIDELTKNKFSFYDRSGKFGDPFMNREYIELTPYQENNTTN